MRCLITLITCLFSAAGLFAQAASSTASSNSPFTRHYVEGEKLAYTMKGNNEGWTYEVQANGTVKKDANGHFVEEYGWSDFKSNASMTLSPESLGFRQTVSLDPAAPPAIPNLSQVQPFLIGPITDLLTFYSDLWLVIRQGNLQKAGDHAYVKLGMPASWADGSRVFLGQDSIDFDLTVKDVDTGNHVATLLVRHVPPAEPKVKLPAAWMQTPVADTRNNFINVQKTDSGKYAAEVGKETFDVEIKVSLPDGRILSSTLDNTVVVTKRECSDDAFKNCGEASPHTIHRKIELQSIAPQK